MKASELRIGNWYSIVGKDFMLTEDGMISCMLNKNYKAFEPIPLTEEWLVKLGFIKTIDGFESTNEYFPFSIEINSLGVAELYMEFYGGGNYKKLIRHANQLQNLYFALTGEELTTSPH